MFVLPREQRRLASGHHADHEADEAGGGAEALHRALLPRLPLHLPHVGEYSTVQYSTVQYTVEQRLY